MTFAELSKLGQDDLQSGLAEQVVTVSSFVSNLPVVTVAGNAYAFNREATIADGALIAADGTYTPAAQPTFDPVTLALRGIVGQHDITGLDMKQGTGANRGNNPSSIAYAVAAKQIGRRFEQLVLTGTVGANSFDGLDALLTAIGSSQLIDLTSTDPALTFAHLDDLMSRVISKGNRPDFIMGNARAENAIKALMRQAGGVTTVELNGRYFTAYDGVPFLRNDWISNDVDGGTAGNQTNIFAGNWESGAKDGIAMVLPEGDMFNVEAPYKLEGSDLFRHRTIMYGALAVHNIRGVACLRSVTV
jgi:hypothetical protein